MRTLYTILFFADLVLLVLLSYLLLGMVDKGAKNWTTATTGIAVCLSILLLVHFIRNYLKQPGSQN